MASPVNVHGTKEFMNQHTDAVTDLSPYSKLETCVAIGDSHFSFAVSIAMQAGQVSCTASNPWAIQRYIARSPFFLR